jgi:hypothetical protein
VNTVNTGNTGNPVKEAPKRMAVGYDEIAAASEFAQVTYADVC